MAETLFNTIISTIAILSNFILTHLWAHIFYSGKFKKPKIAYIVSWILFIVLNFHTNLWISLHLAVITYNALKSVKSSILQNTPELLAPGMIVRIIAALFP